MRMAELHIETQRLGLTELTAPLLILLQHEGERGPEGVVQPLDEAFGGTLSRAAESGDFTGRKDEVLTLFPPRADARLQRLLLVGLGKRADFTLERLRGAVGVAVRQVERLEVDELALSLAGVADDAPSSALAEAAIEAAVLAVWNFLELKTQPPEGAPRKALQRLILVASTAEQEGEYRKASLVAAPAARAENLARQLANRPGNVATPTHLASVASDLAARLGMRVQVLDRAALQREGMQALLAVAQGSEEEPRFIALEYRGADDDRAPLVLVGKGVTFDAGGISIKPAANMEEMKFDMSGAAAVLGACQAVAELGLPANVVGLVPSTENLLSGRAVKPGDVIGSHLGKTIEVVNTDAEGRLILADALSFARRYQPAAIVDAATLTGACVVALGNQAIGLMGNDDALVEEVRAAGERAGQRCWPLPLWDEYRTQLDSEVADIKNSGGRSAGTITAGWFLKEFVGDTPWVHLDIAGTAWGDHPPAYLRKGATGVPTRLFIEWVRTRATT